MKKLKWWPAIGLTAVASVALTGCGGNSSDGSASVRVLNATLSHPSIDLLVNAGVSATAVTSDSVSSYSSPSSGSVVLQINDTGQSTALTTISPTIGSGAHDTVIAYEVSGVVRTTLLPEDVTAPASGASALRIMDAAIDAGALDIYVTAPGVALSTVAPTFTLTAQNYVQLLDPLTQNPGTYEIRVTGQGNKADLRADIQNVTLASTQLGLVVLTPAAGGILLNGNVLIQQGNAAAAGRNTNARVRLVTGMTGATTVNATVGGTAIGTGASPAVGTYSLVPVASPITVSVNGATTQTIAGGTLAAGSDDTLLLTGQAASPSLKVLTDDNHLPASSTNLKARLVNGLSVAAGSTAPSLTMSVNFSTFAGASNIASGAASSYGSLAIPSNTGSQIDVTSSTGASVYSKAGLGLSQNVVYSLFILGDPAAPFTQLSQDR